jgi:diguanylate cyclase (GGDEF)-like protein
MEYRKHSRLNDAILAVAVLFALVLAATMYLIQRNNAKLEDILTESIKSKLLAEGVKSKLLAICFTAGEIVYDHIELFKKINTEEDIDRYRKEFDAAMQQLRAVRTRVGVNTGDNMDVKNIYAIKKIGDKYFSIFDTDPRALKGHGGGDPDTPGIVTEYAEISKVHLDAFDGNISVGIMSSKDQWGFYSTGAIPLYDPQTHKTIGVLGVDIDDDFIERSRQTAAATAKLLAIVMVVSMGALLTMLILLIRRNAAMQADLYRIANHDLITGLPNRHCFFNYLKGKNELLSTGSVTFVTFFIDLDNFKRVNDSAGHHAGDELLRKIAEFLERSQHNHRGRNPENSGEQALLAMTARIGGDEFLQIIPDVASEAEAAALAQRLLADFKAQSAFEPFIQNLGVGLSIGIALFPSMSNNYSEVMRLADIAMYHAKYSGKSNFAFYRPEMANSMNNQKLSTR